jgi:two-component system OmpR family sensor kinase
LVAVFFFYLKFEEEQNSIQIRVYHESLSNYLFQNKMPLPNVIEHFEKINFKVEQNHQEVLSLGKIIAAKRGFESIVHKQNNYIHILTPRFRILFKDLNKYNKSINGYAIFVIMLFLLVFIYLWLLKSLKPLQELKEHINKFANGDLKIDCSSNKKDEIAEVANEFNKAVKEIDLLLNSRQLFLRTVMHELKTPIAKGRIVSELVEDDKQKDRLIQILEKMDFLINDFAKVEQVVSKNYNINKHVTSLEKIVENSISMLMLDNQSDKIKLELEPDIKIEVDLDLISMAFKNLIDNALKYSIDKKVKIKYQDNNILFISDGDALTRPLKDYFKPFHNDTKSKNHGMGLGLYIVKSILDMHSMTFEYEYKNSTNIFIISYNK